MIEEAYLVEGGKITGPKAVPHLIGSGSRDLEAS